MRKPIIGILIAALLGATGCGSSGGTATAPTTVVGIWDLQSVDFTNAAHATASAVISFDLRADNTSGSDSRPCGTKGARSRSAPCFRPARTLGSPLDPEPRRER